jgi:hypothetical protein
VGAVVPLESEQEDPQVAKKGHTEEQILRALHQAESGSEIGAERQVFEYLVKCSSHPMRNIPLRA